jgi:hypothetical protein
LTSSFANSIASLFLFNPSAMASEKPDLTSDALSSKNGTEGVPRTDTSSDQGSIRSEDLVVGDYGSDRHHVFADPKVADYWASIYENAKYECRHRFDPTITWSADEEKKLKRRVCPSPPRICTETLTIMQIDLRIMIWCWMMFLALDLNRRNINRGEPQTQANRD